jgi:MFS family permease
MRRLVAKHGEAKLALMGFVSMLVAYPFLGLAHTWPLLVLLVSVSSFGVAVVRPSLTTLLTQSVGRDEQGAALGTSQSLASISQIVGPSMAGFFIQHQQLWAYGLTAGLFALVGAVLSGQDAPSTEAVGSA